MHRFARVSLAACAAGILALCFLWWWFAPRLGAPAAVDFKTSGNPQPRLLAARAAAIERRERLVDQTIWAREIEAQSRARLIEDFWDRLNAPTNRWAIAREFPLTNLTLPSWTQPEVLPHGIQIFRPTTASQKLPNLHAIISQAEADGWQLAQLEFRHRRFESDRSTFYFAADLTHPSKGRASLEGDVEVFWPASVDASKLTLKRRPAAPAFEPWLESTMPRGINDPAMEPLLALDFDNDAALELAAAGGNKLWSLRDGQWLGSQFLKGEGVRAAVAADFTGDSATDLLAVRRAQLTLFRGPWTKNIPWEGSVISPLTFGSPQVLTCGDIDSDGDLDVFFGAYIGPFRHGAMPTPYYDANNSEPSFLLLNDGKGNFTDATEASGIAKRNRHVYAASFVDLDSDKDLDLIVTSDFAGLDVWRNNGKGKFEDATQTIAPERWGFGMAHAFSDFNNDGALDVLMIGMTSPTASRLEHANLNRPDSRFDPTMRARMSFGNRLLLGSSNGHFRSAPISEAIRDAGWAWGATAADFDNDGWVDVYIANGMESNRSVRDYESELWLHDVFVGSERPDPAREHYFKMIGGRLRGQEERSFGGYERNRFYLNIAGNRFEEVGHLLGVALPNDSRSAVAEDFDGDGRLDLAVTTFEVYPKVVNRLLVFRNQLNNLGEMKTIDAPAIGQVINIGKSARVRVAGDGYNSQQSGRLHFSSGRKQ